MNLLNDRQRRILFGGVILFVLMGLFPPWTAVPSTYNTLIFGETTFGRYAFIAFPPLSKLMVIVKIDVLLLLDQWLILIAVTILGVFIWPGPGKSAPPKKPNLYGGTKGIRRNH